MSQHSFNQEHLDIDKIIDTALKDYEEELEKSEIKNWTFESQNRYIEEIHDKYNRKSISYINQTFPIENTDNLLNIFNNNTRLLLYLYSGKRDNQFDKIKEGFKIKLNNI